MRIFLSISKGVVDFTLILFFFLTLAGSSVKGMSVVFMPPWLRHSWLHSSRDSFSSHVTRSSIMIGLVYIWLHQLGFTYVRVSLLTLLAISLIALRSV